MFSPRIRLFLVLIALAGIAAFLLFQRYIAGGTVPDKGREIIVRIPTNSTFEEVVDILKAEGALANESIFRRLASVMKYERDPMRAGRYEIKPGWNMIQLIRHLRGGQQAPVNLVLNNERLLEDVAGKVARFIEPDSATLIQLFRNDTYLSSIGYNQDDLMSLFIPNTYQFFWNTSAESFMERMIREHDSWWAQNGRREKAQKLGLSEKQVYTLASIVEKETIRNSEKARIAGAYLNRIRIGMPLQADPTAVFATKDFETPRVTEYHIKFDSPFNTYKYAGLPPGPITMASIPSLDAVLNAEKHNYVFFCSLGDESGLHAFAETYEQHLVNVDKFVETLRRRGLR